MAAPKRRKGMRKGSKSATKRQSRPRREFGEGGRRGEEMAGGEERA